MQDRWTRGRLTLQGALRYDRASSFSPADEQRDDADVEVQSRRRSRSRGRPGVDAFNDITPRVGVAYDVFGNGKTALKFNLGHYLAAATNDSEYTSNNPAVRIVRTAARNWTDTNGNKVVDCDILNSGAQTPAPAMSIPCGASDRQLT